MHRFRLVEKLQKKTLATATLKLRLECQIDLGRKALIFLLKLLHQILVQRYRYLTLGHCNAQRPTVSVTSALLQAPLLALNWSLESRR